MSNSFVGVVRRKEGRAQRQSNPENRLNPLAAASMNQRRLSDPVPNAKLAVALSDDLPKRHAYSQKQDTQGSLQRQAIPISCP